MKMREPENGEQHYNGFCFQLAMRLPSALVRSPKRFRKCFFLCFGVRILSKPSLCFFLVFRRFDSSATHFIRNSRRPIRLRWPKVGID